MSSRLGAPPAALLAPEMAQIRKNMPKSLETHLKHPTLENKRTLQDHVSGGPEPDNSCLLLLFFLAPLAHQPQPEQ